MNRFTRGRRRSVPLPTPRRGLRLDDRGVAKYFHGRTEEISLFESLCHSAMESNGGAMLIIQGPPGAGKTALLHECAQHARDWGWQVAGIPHDAIWNKRSLRNSLKPPRFWTNFDLQSISANIAGFGGGGGWGLRETAQLDLLQRHVRKTEKGVLLVLDEAQALYSADVTGSEKNAAVITLDAIHNGRLGKPVVMLAGGLGHTHIGLSRFEISRAGSEDLVNLSHIDAESERAIIGDWLRIEGRAKGDAKHWVDAIAHETEGWPQHISAYGQRAAQQLRKDNGRLTSGGLTAVLVTGREDKSRFYEHRLGEIGRYERPLLGLLVVCCGRNAAWAHVHLTAALSAIEGYLEASPHQTVDTMIQRGVLAATTTRKYHIPIPSMERYLVGYARDLEQEDGVWVQEIVNDVVAALDKAKYKPAPDRGSPVLSGRLRDVLAQMVAVPALHNRGTPSEAFPAE